MPQAAGASASATSPLTPPRESVPSVEGLKLKDPKDFRYPPRQG